MIPPEFVPFISVTETWAKQYTTDSQMTIKQYNLFRSDRKLRRRGGVALFIHNSISVDSFWSFDNKYCEVGLAYMKSSKTILIVLYRPQICTVSHFKEALSFIEEKLNSFDESCTIMLTGDFNFPNICWDDLSLSSGYTKVYTDSASCLLHFMEKFLMNQIIDIPTRRHNTLDLFITNKSDLALDVLTVKSSVSDHMLVKIPLSYSFGCSDTSVQRPSQQFIEKSFNCLDFSKANYDILSSIFDTIDWDTMQAECAPGTFAAEFHSKVLSICLENVPAKPKFSSNNHKKGNPNLARKKRKMLARLFALKQHNPESPQIPVLEVSLKNVEVYKKNKIIQTKIRNELKAIESIKSNPAFFYKYAKKYAKAKSRIGPLKHPMGSVTNDPQSMANLLQDQFSSVFSDPSCPDKLDPTFPCASSSLNFISFDASSISKAIDEFHENSAAGEDLFPICLLKSCKSSLSYPIYCIWKESFETGLIPDSLKSQVVIPVFKKGSKLHPKNYRPIALTSNIIKNFERVIRTQLVHYLESNNLITKNQHGFRKGFSCTSELLIHYDDILSNMIYDDADTDLIYLDFAKAFDKVDHDLLLKKLKLYGIEGKLHNWLSNFLTGRRQSVIVDSFRSYTTTVCSGVPQGTVLGPILFLLFINDIELCLNDSRIRCFADDSRLSKAIKSSADVTSLQNDLNKVLCWAKENNMQLNEDKFQLLQHHVSSRNFNSLLELPFVYYDNCYLANQTVIDPSSHLSDLGITMQEDLSFKFHISDIVKKARDKLSWALGVFKSRSELVICTLYKSLIRPIVEYCCVVWNSSKLSDISSVEAIQRTATSKIASLSHLNYWDRLKELNLMSLQRRRERYIIIYMHKILHGRVPNDIGINFYSNPRLGMKARLPPLPPFRSWLYTYDSSFAVNGPKLWNLLPKKINTLIKFESFKQQLDNFILRYPDHPPVHGYITANSNSLLHWV